jgi:periplasmic protein TonB
MNIRNTATALIVLVFIILITSQSCLVKKSTTVEQVDSSLVVPAKAQVDTEYYSTVETQASFQNGDINTFITYLKKNTKYPATALKKKQQGTTAVQFGVDCYGSVKVFAVLKSSGFKVLDNEAVRAIKSSPKWSPAKIKEVSVGQLFLLQIKFNAKTRKVEIK